MPGGERFDIQFTSTPDLTLVAEGFFVTRQRLDEMVRPTQRVVDEVFVPEIETNFLVEGRPPWEQLAPSTVKKRGSAHPILQDRGKLIAAATSGSAWVVSPETRGATAVFDMGMLPDYAPFHVSGTHFMPQRDFTTISDDADERIDQIFAEFVDEAVEAGLSVMR